MTIGEAISKIKNVEKSFKKWTTIIRKYSHTFTGWLINWRLSLHKKYYEKTKEKYNESSKKKLINIVKITKLQKIAWDYLMKKKYNKTEYRKNWYKNMLGEYNKQKNARKIDLNICVEKGLG